MLVLCLGLDGADYQLVRELVSQGRLPTLARLERQGVFAPLESTVPPFSPTAWSSFLTGLNPGGHGIFGFSANPNRARKGVESAVSRGGTPLWEILGAAGIRSAYVTIPLTHPAHEIDGVVVTGFGGPDRPQIAPARVAARVFAAHPDLTTARYPEALRWWEEFEPLVRMQHEHIEQLVDVSTLILELEPDLSLLAVDFMSSDIIGHFGWYRLDAHHPAHSPENAGDEIVRVYEMLDHACGELIERAEWLLGEEPTVVVLSDHGMRPTYWTFRTNRWLESAGYLRFAEKTPTPTGAVEQGGTRKRRRGRTEDRHAHDETHRVQDEWPIDMERTHAYGFGYGGQLYVAEGIHGKGRRQLIDELVACFSSIPHPETGQPAFSVMRKEELYRGPYLDKAPELFVVPRDERIFLESSRRPGEPGFHRLDDLVASERRFSGQHGRRGILAAAGPGIRTGLVPEGTHIAQIPATLLSLLGLDPVLEAPPIGSIVDIAAPTTRPDLAARARSEEARVYTAEQEEQLIARLRDLGYE